jgi:hypothetical protein
MFTICEISKNSDETEGRGPMKPIKYIKDRDEAIKYIEAQPDAWGREREWKGDRYGDFQLGTIPVFESLAEIEDYEPVDLKSQALAKLTPEEKRALGL